MWTTHVVWHFPQVLSEGALEFVPSIKDTKTLFIQRIIHLLNPPLEYLLNFYGASAIKYELS